MSKLTTHVLDTHGGHPAANLRIELHRVGVQSELVTTQITNTDGRCSKPMLEGSALRIDKYTLTFHVAEYFRAMGVSIPEPAFLDHVVVHFGIADPDQNYHVPLLVTPWSYSVYRGS
ncbi:MAG: hydroxyisourate hydrolase [Povalibacter sp.]